MLKLDKIKTDELKNQLIELSRQNSIDLIGFAKVENFEIEIEHYKRWVESGYNANMRYMGDSIKARRDVRLLNPEAKSVIVIALSYFHSFEANSSFRVSRYAWSYDYHKIVEEKLLILKNLIEEYYPNSLNLLTVDTKPVLEKQWARRAGIGWQGKNSLIINPEYGSYMFLGTIISSVEISPSIPMKNYCGDCRKCLENCKTGAIVKEKVIDCRKCLSYLTLEEKEVDKISDNYKELIYPFLFGCDDCQICCPFNQQNIPESRNFSILWQNLDYKLILSSISDKNKFEELYRDTSIYDKMKQIKKLYNSGIYAL